MRVGPILTLVLVAGTISALWWLETLRERDRPAPADPAEYHAPEAYFEQFIATGWRGDGTPRHVLSGERMERFTDDKTSEIQAPRLRYHMVTRPSWYIASDHGRVDADGDRIDLRDRVVALRNPTPPDPLVMRTETLTVFLDAGRGETDAPVDVVSAGTRVHSTGMTALFDTGRIDLHNDVRGQHDPTIDAQ